MGGLHPPALARVNSDHHVTCGQIFKLTIPDHNHISFDASWREEHNGALTFLFSIWTLTFFDPPYVELAAEPPFLARDSAPGRSAQSRSWSRSRVIPWNPESEAVPESSKISNEWRRADTKFIWVPNGTLIARWGIFLVNLPHLYPGCLAVWPRLLAPRLGAISPVDGTGRPTCNCLENHSLQTYEKKKIKKQSSHLAVEIHKVSKVTIIAIAVLLL